MPFTQLPGETAGQKIHNLLWARCESYEPVEIVFALLTALFGIVLLIPGDTFGTGKTWAEIKSISIPGLDSETFWGLVAFTLGAGALWAWGAKGKGYRRRMAWRTGLIILYGFFWFEFTRANVISTATLTYIVYVGVQVWVWARLFISWNGNVS